MTATIYDLYAAGRTVNHGFFVQFNFASGAKRVWNGLRYIDLGGYTWAPVGPRATLDQIEDQVTDQVPSITFTVSGVDTAMMASALADSGEIQGQLAFVYDQFFDEDWQPVGAFETFGMYRMDTIKIRRSQNQDGSWDQVVELTAEGFLTQGPYPPNGRYTAADQAARYPDVADQYFEFMSQNEQKIIRWPTF